MPRQLNMAKLETDGISLSLFFCDTMQTTPFSLPQLDMTENGLSSFNHPLSLVNADHF